MSAVHDELQSFHRFAAQRLAQGGTADSLDELLMEWHDQRDRAATRAAIQRGLDDVASGRFVSAEQSLDDLRREFDLPRE